MENKLINKNKVFELLKYISLSSVSVLVEWASFYIFNSLLSINFQISTILAFFLSAFVNWLVLRTFMFSTHNDSLIKELGKVYLTDIGGLLLNIILMGIFVSVFSFDEFLSKIISSILVGLYNFLIRKIIIYK